MGSRNPFNESGQSIDNNPRFSIGTYLLVVIPSMNQVNQSRAVAINRILMAVSRNPFNESGQSIAELKELMSDPKIRVVIPSMNQVNQSLYKDKQNEY